MHSARWIAMLFGTTLLVGCTQVTKQTRIVSDGQHQVLAEPEAGHSSVAGRLVLEQGVVLGRLAWSTDCRLAVEEWSHADVIRVEKPRYGAAVVGLILGGALSAASIALIRKDLDDGADLTLPGGMLGIGALAVAAGAATFVIRSNSKVVESVPQPPRLLRVEGHGQPCGDKPLAELGVSLYQGANRLARSLTNEDALFALVVPSRTTGPMRVVIDSVPPGFEMLRPNEQVGLIEIPAVAQYPPLATPSQPEQPEAAPER